jgi:asparagine synthase (glutamine-hydrolysing)
MEAAAEFFRFGFVPPPATLFRGIRKLPPGCRIVADDAGIVLQQYWDMSFERSKGSDRFDECCEQLRELLQEVVRDQMMSDVPLGAFLSGGVDSSAVVAFMRRFSDKPVNTFSIGFGARHSYHNESHYAEAVARQLDTRHETLVVQPRAADLLPELVEKLDEPLTDTSFLVTYLVSQLAQQHVKVALSGLGGDELFGGYRRYFAPLFHRSVRWLPDKWRLVLGRQLSRRMWADRGTALGNLGRYAKAVGKTLHLPLAEQYVGMISILSAEQLDALIGHNGASCRPACAMLEFFQRCADADALDQLLYVDAQTVLPESLLLLTDRMGMATSLEVRVPFLDNRVVDFVTALPSEYRVRGFSLKRLLKAALSGVVPEFVLTRAKRGFGTPMGAWLREDLRPMVDELLDEDRLRRTGLLDARLVRQIIAAHESGSDDFTEAITALLVFEIWRERLQMRLP